MHEDDPDSEMSHDLSAMRVADEDSDQEVPQRTENRLAQNEPFVRELNHLTDVYNRINEVCERFPNGQGLEPRHAALFLNLGDSLHDAWMVRLRGMSATALTTFAFRVFGYSAKDNQEGIDYNVLIREYAKFIKPIVMLQQQIAALMGLNSGAHVLDAATMCSLTDMTVNRLMLVKHVIVRLKHHIESLRDCQSLSRVTAIAEVGQCRNPVDVSFLEQNSENMNDIHHLIVYIANRLQAHQFKRFGDRCYEQRYVRGDIKVLDEESNMLRKVPQRVPTRYWRENCTLEEFINRQCDKETNFRYWKTLTGSRDATQRLVEHFSRPGGGEMEFPELQVNRHWFAFQNGIYDTQEQLFYAYSEVHLLPQPLGKSFACLNLFDDVMFNEKILEADVDNLQKIMDIPTPVFDSIFEHQKMERDVIKWIYVFFGRMFYALHDWDKWQVVPFLKGVAGTGKSTLGNLLLRIFPQEFVGNLSSNVEKQFGLDTLADKFIWICLEVKSNFQLPLNDLQSVISGELVQVARKFKDARTIKWGSAGMMFGNEVPPWKDIAGALMRRFVLFMFEQKVDEAIINSNLLEDLHRELGTIIPKVTMVYRRVALEGGSKDVWHLLPEYFKLSRRKFLTSTSPIATFLDETTRFVKEQGEYVPLQEFSTHFLEWMRQNRPADRLVNVTPEVYSHPFQVHGLTVQKAERIWEGRRTTAEFVMGLKLNGQV